MTYGYIRVSSDKQTVENQRFEINKFCKNENINIDGWIEETISGTKNYDKRKLGELLNKVQKDDLIICAELSRLGRNLFMIMEILHICMNKECKVWTIKDNYRLGDDIQSKVLAFAFGLSAEIERNLISQRTKEALARKVNEGVVLGRPKGRKTSPSKHKLFQKDEIICELLICGISQRKTAKLLHVDRNTLANFMQKSEIILENSFLLKNSGNKTSDFVQHNSSACDFATSDSWVILSPIEQSIKRKIEAVGVPLKDWNISINYGIKTGFNDAFIVSGAKRDEILANCKTDEEREKTAELIRPILRGRDIKRYSYNWADLWLIYIPWHFPLQFDQTIQGASEKAEKEFKKQYPAVYAHLLQYKRELSARNKAETGIRYEWYAMQRWGANYWDEFNKPKIVWGNLNLSATYTFAPAGMMINAPATMIVPASESLLCILNSKLADYYIRNLGVTRNGGYFEYKPMFIEQLPVPQNIDEKLFEELSKKELNNEEEIDRKVYELYGLTDEEIQFLEKM